MSVPSNVSAFSIQSFANAVRQLQQRAASGRWRTRFAPAPTGALHLGHVVNAVYVWGLARAFGGSVTVRIEDHDTTRCKAEFERGILDDLHWLGLESDDASTTELRAHPSRFRQSDNADRYLRAFHQLEAKGLTFPCRCTRRDIAEVVGHRDNVETRYPGTCRNAAVSASETAGRRLRIEPGEEHFYDLLTGPLTHDPSRQCGDLLIRDRNGNWTYQFAVVVDDMDHNIDVVIRGADLIESTGRQLRVARLLGRATPPLFAHHVLVRHHDGSKLSKSSGDTGIREMREQGMTREDVFGRAAHATGLTAVERPMAFPEIVEAMKARG